MRSQSLAIAFFDVSGYAESAARWTRDEAPRALAVHHAVLSPTLDAFGGRGVKSSAGSHLAQFDSPTNAVLCAAAVHDRAAAFSRESPSDAVTFRAGIALGEVRVQRRDVFGDAVNIAARLVGLAEPGEILLAEVVYLAMNKAEVPSEEVGERALKGIPEKVRVYRVPKGRDRLAAAVSPQGSNEVGPGPAPRPAWAEALPYGGLGLAHVPDLPPVRPQPAGAGRAVLSTLGLPALRDLREPAIAAANRIFGDRRVAAALGAILVVGLLVGLARTVSGDAVERMIDRGEFEPAQQAIAEIDPGPRRAYLEGRLAEGKKRPARAVEHYRAAAKSGSARAIERLIAIIARDECEARESAARALGDLRVSQARSGLERLASDPEADRGIRIGGVSIGCNAASAAREALRALDEPPLESR